MVLSRSKTSSPNVDFIDLMNPTHFPNHTHEDDSVAAASKEEILPSYDFHPIRPAAAPLSSGYPAMGGGGDGGGFARTWNPADSTNAGSSPTTSYGYLGATEPDKVILEKDQHVNDVAIVCEIGQTMKRHTDTLLHAIDDLSTRLLQLESRTRQFEHSVDDLKVSIGNNHGSTDGKMRQMENILRGVQSGVQDLKDKQEAMDLQIQLAKLHMPKVDRTLETHDTTKVSSTPQTASAPQQSNIQLPVASLKSLPPPPLQQQIVNPPMQPPNQHPPTPTYFTPPGSTLEMSVPPAQQQQQQQKQTLPPPPAASQHQQYELAPPAPYPHAPQLPQQPPPQVAAVNPPPQQLQPLIAHQTYPPGLHQPSSQPTGVPSLSQQFYTTTPPPSNTYDSPRGRSSSGFPSSAYAPPAGPGGPYPYSGSSLHYVNNPAIKPQPPSPKSGGNYPQIPTARILPQVIPASSAVSGGTNSGGTGNRVPVDDVVDKVTNMGFPREHVQASVRKLTENGQPVDLNVVLDKLMNDGNVQPPRGWFGR